MEPNTTVPTPVQSPVTSTALPKMEGPVELIKFAWNLFKHTWKVIVPIIILPSVVNYIGTLFMAPGSAGLAIVGFIVTIIGIILSVAMLPASVNAVHRLSTEVGVILSLGEQYRLGFRYFWSVIWVVILVVLVNIGSFMLLIIPGIVVVIYMGFYSYALVLDGKRGWSALTESYTLVRGRWFAVLGRLLFLGVVFIVAWLILAGILFILGLGGDKGGVSGAVAGIINLIASAIMAPIGIAYSYRMYMSLKSLRTGEVSTKTFKGWLIGFLCVGILSIVVAVGVVPAILATSINKARLNTEDARLNAESSMAEVQRLIQESQPTSN